MKIIVAILLKLHLAAGFPMAAADELAGRTEAQDEVLPEAQEKVLRQAQEDSFLSRGDHESEEGAPRSPRSQGLTSPRGVDSPKASAGAVPLPEAGEKLIDSGGPTDPAGSAGKSGSQAVDPENEAAEAAEDQESQDANLDGSRPRSPLPLLLSFASHSVPPTSAAEDPANRDAVDEEDLEIQDAGPFDAENPEADEGDAAEYAGMQISF